jgi:hypothetical protein
MRGDLNMPERRPLTEGLKPPPTPAESRQEQDFVFGPKTPSRTAAEPKRVALSTRIRGDFVQALKRLSLQRQLDGVAPNTINEFLEQAIEPWLKQNDRSS